MKVEKGQPHLESEYPCMAAVNRAASVIDRHDARLIWLTYKPLGEVKRTVYLVGKVFIFLSSYLFIHVLSIYIAPPFHLYIFYIYN